MTQLASQPCFSIDAAGWGQQVPSPHHNERVSPDDISLLVVHGISLPPGEFGGPFIDDLFMGRLDPEAHPYFAGIHQLRVSAHCLIRRDGELVQYVPFGARAWHAGISSWQGREACNDFSIGIELEGADEIPYTEAQYRALAGLTEPYQIAIRRLPTKKLSAIAISHQGARRIPEPVSSGITTVSY